jgi:N-acetylmuramoyl-L-alanine amidase
MLARPDCWVTLIRLRTLTLSVGVLVGMGWFADILHAAGREVPALKGDGIYRLLRRHGLDPEAYLKEFRRLNQDRLGAGDILIQGRLYVLPTTDRSVFEPLLGDAWAKVDRVDDQLRGAVFYLMSGHGGPDPGGMGKLDGHTLCEDEYAYDVTLRLGRRLMAHGAKVYFVIQDRNDGIRDGRYLKPDSDEVSYSGKKIPANQRARLAQRVDIVNSLYRKDPGATYKRCLAIHVDARRKAEDIDIFFYYQSGNSVGKRLALTLRSTIRENYRESQPGRGYEGTVTTRGLYVLNHSKAPLVFIELGNIHHARDQVRLLKENNRQAMANWLCEGILADVKKSR